MPSSAPSAPPSPAPEPSPAPSQIPDPPQNHFPPNQIRPDHAQFLKPIVIALEPSPDPIQIPDSSQKPPQNNPEGKCVTVAPMQGSSAGRADIGSPCVFPFIHYGKIWNECVFELIGKGSNLHWCSTQVCQRCLVVKVRRKLPVCSGK